MRDPRFVAEHRGGPLKKKDHQLLMRWAISCSEHVLHLAHEDLDPGMEHALEIAKLWQKGKVETGKCMKASLGAHAAARKYKDPVMTALARSIGQCVATAHMSDHSMGAALYALKALNHAGKDVNKERKWQHKQLEKLPVKIRNLIKEVMKIKAESFKL